MISGTPAFGLRHRSALAISRPQGSRHYRKDACANSKEAAKQFEQDQAGRFGKNSVILSMPPDSVDVRANLPPKRSIEEFSAIVCQDRHYVFGQINCVSTF